MPSPKVYKTNRRNCKICGKHFKIVQERHRTRYRATCSDACQNKLIRVNYRPWTSDELNHLRDIAETLPIKQLINNFNRHIGILGLEKRTGHSIRSKLVKLGYSQHVKHGVYTAGVIARTLDIPFGTVTTWFRYGLEFYRLRDAPTATKYITSKNLRDFARKRPQSFGGCKFVDLYLILEDRQLTEYIVKNFPRRPGRIAPQKVRCIETNQVFKSYVEAGRKFFLTPSAIYKSATFGEAAAGYHFEKIQDSQEMSRVQPRVNPRAKQQQPV
jgi:endogenous inhibitor of DNA gyrase (YacG/DUF329 family)